MSRDAGSKASKSAAHHSFTPHPVCLLIVGALLSGGCARGHSQAAAAPQLPALEFAGEWGMRGEDPGQLNDPVGPAVDSDGRVYFVNRGRESVDKFETEGVPLQSFEDPAARSASGIAVDHGGGIYVADAHVGAVRVFFPEGDFYRSFHITPQRNLMGPFGFSVDAEGQIFVPDSDSGRIQCFTLRGAVERTWKAPANAAGQPGHPGIALAAPDGFVYVGDARSGRIVKYAADGRQVLAWPETPGPAAPLLGLAASPKYLFVLRDAAPRLEVWTLDGQRKLSDNLGGRLDGASPSRASLAVTPQNELIVLDPAVPRVLRFHIHLDSP